MIYGFGINHTRGYFRRRANFSLIKYMVVFTWADCVETPSLKNKYEPTIYI